MKYFQVHFIGNKYESYIFEQIIIHYDIKKVNIIFKNETNLPIHSIRLSWKKLNKKTSQIDD